MRPVKSGCVIAIVVGLAAAQPAYRWQEQTSGVTARLRGVSAASDRVVWARGARGTVLRTDDGGASWHTLMVADADTLDFRDVDAIDADTAYLLSIGPHTASRVYKTTNAGATWTLQFTNEEPKGFFDAMAFWDARRGLVMGDSIEGRFDVLRTMDGGASWTRVKANGLPPALPNEGAFAGSGTNIAVMAGGHAWIGTGAASRSRMLHTSDYGATWTVVETPVAAAASAGIFSVAFRDPRNGMTVGGDYRKERDAVDNAAVTHDGGRTWSRITGLSGFRSVVAPVPGAPRSWIAVGPSGADVSSDDGSSWSAVAGEGYHAFAFAPGKPVGWGVGENGRIGKLTK